MTHQPMTAHIIEAAELPLTFEGIEWEDGERRCVGFAYWRVRCRRASRRRQATTR